VTAGYFPWDVCNTVSLQLEAWCSRYTTAARATEISANALAFLLREAMRGEKTSTGPLRRLYKHAEFGLRWGNVSGDRDVPFGIWKTIPDPGEHLLCEFTRAYACVYMGMELSQMSLLDQHILARTVAGRTHSLEGHWFLPTDGTDPSEVFALVQRVIQAWDEHAHGPVGCCAEFDELWEHEHNKAHQWHHRWRRDTNGGLSGLTKQADHPRYHRATVADDRIHLDRSGGQRQSEPDLWFAPGSSAH